MGAEYLPSPGGAVLRLYIDVPASEVTAEGAQPRYVAIEDCEALLLELGGRYRPHAQRVAPVISSDQSS